MDCMESSRNSASYRFCKAVDRASRSKRSAASSSKPRAAPAVRIISRQCCCELRRIGSPDPLYSAAPAGSGVYMKAFLARALLLAWPCVAIAQVAVLQIKVLEGEGTVHAAGARIPHPVTVEVTDESGRPVAGAAVSFQLPSEGPSGLFSNGLRTDLVLTDAAGRAAVHSMQLNRTGGPFRIRITAVKELARAGAISTQYIGESHNATVASVKPAASTPQAPPQSTPQSTPQATPPQASPQAG